MKPALLFALLTTVCPLAMAQLPYASLQVPKQIHYQGRVATATGGEWSGSEGYFSFALIQGATILWNNWEGTASPSDPGAVTLGAGQVLTQPVNHGAYSIRLGEGSDINEEIPATVFFDTTSNAVRSGVKLAVWFSPDGGTFIRLSPDVEFTSVPYALVAGIAESVKERAVTTEMINNGAVTGQKIETQVTQSLVPIATILPYGAPIPDNGTLVEPVPGYLFCNGAAIDELAVGGKYAALIAKLQTSWGNGNDTSPATINLPDLRGVFLRGWNGAATDGWADPDRADRFPPRYSGGNVGNLVGSFEADEFKDHNHPPLAPSTFFTGASVGQFNGTSTGTRGDEGFVATTGNRGGSETRPRNANVNYLIKY